MRPSSRTGRPSESDGVCRRRVPAEDGGRCPAPPTDRRQTRRVASRRRQLPRPPLLPPSRHSEARSAPPGRAEAAAPCCLAPVGRSWVRVGSPPWAFRRFSAEVRCRAAHRATAPERHGLRVHWYVMKLFFSASRSLSPFLPPSLPPSLPLSLALSSFLPEPCHFQNRPATERSTCTVIKISVLSHPPSRTFSSPSPISYSLTCSLSQQISMYLSL